MDLHFLWFFRLILQLPVSLHWLKSCVLVSLPLSKIGLRHPISDLILKLTSLPRWLWFERLTSSHSGDSGNKGEQMLCLAFHHDFIKKKHKISSPDTLILHFLYIQEIVFQRICGNNFETMLKCFLPLTVFRASGVCLRQDLLNWAFPGSIEQGPGRVQLKDSCGGCNPTHFSGFP